MNEQMLRTCQPKMVSAVSAEFSVSLIFLCPDIFYQSFSWILQSVLHMWISIREKCTYAFPPSFYVDVEVIVKSKIFQNPSSTRMRVSNVNILHDGVERNIFVWYCSTNLTAGLVCRNALGRWLMKTQNLHETCKLISVTSTHLVLSSRAPDTAVGLSLNFFKHFSKLVLILETCSKKGNF